MAIILIFTLVRSLPTLQSFEKSEPYQLLMYRNSPRFPSIFDCLNFTAWKDPPIKYDVMIEDFKKIEVNQSSILKNELNPLNKDELFAFYLWTRDSRNISTRLRKGKEHGLTCYLRYFFSGFDKLKEDPKDLTLYHGINQFIAINGNFVIKGEYNKSTPNVFAGDSLWSTGLTSTSKNPSVSIEWALNYSDRYVIILNDHFSGKFIEPLATCDERWNEEILFPPGVELIVNDTKTVFCQKKEKVEYIPSWNDSFCKIETYQHFNIDFNCTDDNVTNSTEYTFIYAYEGPKHNHTVLVDGIDPFDLDGEINESSFSEEKTAISPGLFTTSDIVSSTSNDSDISSSQTSKENEIHTDENLPDSGYTSRLSIFAILGIAVVGILMLSP